MATRTSIRSMLRKVEMSVGLPGHYARRTKGAIALTYPGVAPDDSISDRWVQSLHIAPAVLEKQLEFIARHFEVVDLLDKDRIGRASSGRPVAVITFDDGYKNFLEHALPVLERLGIPATLFITVNCVENGTRHPTFICRAVIANLEPGPYDLDSINEQVLITASNRADSGRVLTEKMKRLPWPQARLLLSELQGMFTAAEWRDINAKFSTDAPMSWRDVAEVKRRGVLIGSHTLDHVPLGPQQSAEDIRSQVADSRRLIAERVGECRYFAYPNGTAADICREAVAAVERAGYDLAFTMVPGVVRNESERSARYLMPRLGVSANWDGFRKYVSTAWRHNSRYDALVASLESGNARAS